MKIHDLLFAYGYMLNKKFDPTSDEPEWVSCMSMSITVGFNILSLSALATIVTGNNSLIDFWRSYYTLALFGAILLIGYIYFIKGKRSLAVMEQFEKLTKSQKSMVIWGGVTHVIFSILSLGMLLAIASGVKF